MPVREIIVHVLRTIVMCVGLGAVMLALVVGCILLKTPWWLPLVLVILLSLAIVWGTARWHAYWAPISKQAARIPWERADGTPMETVVEIAIVQAGASRTETFRVSIYELEPGLGGKTNRRRKRVKRVMVGDSAELLGIYDRRLWFYIYDRFHARRDGLTCLDVQTGTWLYHRPRTEVEFVDRVKNRRAVIEVEERGRRREIDLTSEPLDKEPARRE